MKKIYFRPYYKEDGTRGTAYFSNKKCTVLLAMNPYEEHRVNHIATLNCWKYIAIKDPALT